MLLLVAFLAAVIALTGQSQAVAQEECPSTGDRNSSIKFVYDREGSGGPSGGRKRKPFDQPSSVAVAPVTSAVYVADTSNHRIVKFDSEGNYDEQWSSFTGPHYGFYRPAGVAVAPDGSVYVANSTEKFTIVKFDSDGKYDWEWTEESGAGTYEFDRPEGVAVAPDTSAVYVADTENHRIVKFDSEGVLDVEWGTSAASTYEFNYPNSVAVAPDASAVYVADTSNHRIVKFDSEGNYDEQWGSFTGSNGDGEFFCYPKGVAVAPDGSVYVADGNGAENNRIVKFTDTDPVSDVQSQAGAQEDDGDGSDGDCSDHAAFNAMIEGEDEDQVSGDLIFGDLIDCGTLDQESVIEAGQLGYASVLPQGSAGSAGKVKVIFKTTNPIPPRGQVMVIFPEGFTATEDTSIEDAEYFDGLVSWPRFRGLEYLTNDENSKPRSFSLEPKYIYGKSAVVVIPNGVDSGKSVELTLTEVEHAKVSGKPSGAVIKTFTPEGALIDECAKDASVLYFSLPGGTKERIRFTQFIERFWKPIDVLAPDVGDECGIVYTSAKPGTLENLVFKLGDRVPVDDPDLEVPPTAAGSTGEVTVSFTTKNPVPAGGKVAVVFPEGFKATEGVTHERSGSGKDVSFIGDSGRIVTVVIADRVHSNTMVELTLSAIKNPVVTGEPQGGGIVTYNDAEVVIDGACEEATEEFRPREQFGSLMMNSWRLLSLDSVIDSSLGHSRIQIQCASETVTVDRITPGKLKVAENGVVPDNKTAGGTGYVTVTFTLDNPLPVNGAVAVTFPKGFALHCCGSLMEEKASQATFKNRDGSSIEGPYTVTDIKHGDDDKTTALFFRTEGVDVFEEGAEVIVELTNVRNPQQSGQTHNFEIRTSVGK